MDEAATRQSAGRGPRVPLPAGDDGRDPAADDRQRARPAGRVWPGERLHPRARFPPLESNAVPRANSATLDPLARPDLTAEPLILSVPDTGGRYHPMPLQDTRTDVSAVPGKRTSGTAAGHSAVAPPRRQAELPADARRTDAPTPHAWVIARTQANGPGDYPAVRRAQDGFAITPTSRTRRNC
jgi:hypothetical protein